jgi:hypothetical protein
MTHDDGGAGRMLQRAWMRALLCAVLLSPQAWAEQNAAPATSASSAAPEALASIRERMLALNTQSGDLVQKVKSSKADASSFRIQVVLYRESLREMMVANEQAAAAQRVAQQALMEMVRMAALLQAASNCETGRYLACPADLMERLQLQQGTVTAVLKKITQSQ